MTGTWHLAPGTLLLLVACSPADLQPGPIEFSAAVGSVAPNLTAAGDRVILSWTEPSPAGHAVRLAVREAGAWHPAGTVVDNDSLFVNWADFPSVAVMPDGQWVAHWLQKTAPATYAYHVMMRVSSDDGQTWSAAFRPHGDLSPTEHGFVAMAPWKRGLGAVWLDGRKTGGGATEHAAHAGAMTLRFTTLSAGGIPAPDVEVDDRVCDCCQTALAATRSGLVVAYRDRAEGEIRDVVVSRWVDGAWTPAAKVHDDGWHYPGCPVNGPSVAATGDTVAVAWFTAAHETPRAAVAFSVDGGATFGAPVVIDDGRPAGRVDVLWADDRVVVTWLEELPDGGAIRARTVRPDGRLGAPVTVATTSSARASGFPRMARIGDTVLLAWTEADETRRVHVSRLTLR